VSLFSCVRGAGIGVQRCQDFLAIFVIRLMVVGVDSCRSGLGRKMSLYKLACWQLERTVKVQEMESSAGLCGTVSERFHRN
jgi:hypothetical protein